METGSATVVIDRPPAEVFTAITDVSRTGEWSPECTGGRWVDGATPGVGARFEGDNAVVVGGRTMRRWTTTSEVSAYEQDRVFEFVAAEYTTWRYELTGEGDGTRVTESFSYEPTGFRGFIYTTVMRRPKAMQKGTQRTLDRLKAVLEAS